MFVAIDGDDVGSELERLMIAGDPEAVRKYSEQVATAMRMAISELYAHDATLIFAGGDSVLGVCPREVPDVVLSRLPGLHAGVSLSIGTGVTMVEAYLALKVAKGRGKRQWCDYHALERSGLVGRSAHGD